MSKHNNHNKQLTATETNSRSTRNSLEGKSSPLRTERLTYVRLNTVASYMIALAWRLPDWLPSAENLLLTKPKCHSPPHAACA